MGYIKLEGSTALWVCIRRVGDWVHLKSLQKRAGRDVYVITDAHIDECEFVANS